jgi:hypothetical protein
MFSAAGDGGSYNFTVIPSAIEGSSKKTTFKISQRDASTSLWDDERCCALRARAAPAENVRIQKELIPALAK